VVAKTTMPAATSLKSKALRPGTAVAFVYGMLAFGCADAEESCTDTAGVRQAIYDGSETELYLGLAEADIRAIVLIHGQADEHELCTGTAISSEWVLSAAHCLEIPSYSVRSPLAVDSDLEIVEAQRHPLLDVALLRLAQPLANTGAHAVAPLHLQVGALGEEWLDVPVEVAGYGLTHTGQLGTLHFALESLVDVADTTLVVSGDGTSGACYGDSGGPLLMRSDDGQLLIAGVLSEGSASCTGEDLYIRTSAIAEWAQGVMAGIPNDNPARPGAIRRPCGSR
jgi:hypothetical protein